MTSQEIEFLAKKVKEGTATQEDELKLLQFLNMGIEELRIFIKEVMVDAK